MNSTIQLIIDDLSTVIFGKQQQIKLALTCLFSEGHLLIEDLPGMGKTTLSHALAAVLGLSYQRIQFTSDLLPSDILGTNIFDAKEHSFSFHQGPVFSQVVLGDEINRAGPKTQSALLEAMEENQVSIDGTTHLLPTPFFVIATQNPLFHAGTYPLPESQLDRFMMRISLGFPDKNAEKEILKAANQPLNYSDIAVAISLEQLQKMQDHITQVYVSEAILEYIIALFQHTRTEQLSVNPLSPRAGKALVAAAKAWAFMDNRDHVLPDDIKAVFPSVCEHRMAGRQAQGSESFSSQLLSLVDGEQFYTTES